MKTIAIFSGYFVPHLGGIERYVDNLSRELIKKNINVIIVTSNYNNSKNYEEVNGIKIIRLPVYNIFKNRYPIIKKNREYKLLMSKLNKYKIDAIIVNTRFHLTTHVGVNYGKRKNIPIYLIEHGSNYVTLNNKFIDFFANRYEDSLTFKIKNKIKGFYGVSNACSDWLKKFKIDSSGTWYNSIDCTQKLPKKSLSTKVTYLYAGRIIKQKGVKNILEAFSRLEKNNDNILLYIAGDGPELKYYKTIFKSPNIIFLGKLNYDNLMEYYAKADIFLYPPLWPEGLPTSILEAGLMKCATIGTNQGGIKEILQNRKNGLIVNDTSEALFKAMLELLKNKDERLTYAKNLNETIKQKFSWEKTASKIISDIGVNNNGK